MNYDMFHINSNCHLALNVWLCLSPWKEPLGRIFILVGKIRKESFSNTWFENLTGLRFSARVFEGPVANFAGKLLVN